MLMPSPRPDNQRASRLYGTFSEKHRLPLLRATAWGSESNRSSKVRHRDRRIVLCGAEHRMGEKREGLETLRTRATLGVSFSIFVSGKGLGAVLSQT